VRHFWWGRARRRWVAAWPRSSWPDPAVNDLPSYRRRRPFL